MRFACDSCRAQYNIADEKVGERGVKVRCKKCGHVIHVRRPEAEAEGAVAGLQETEPPVAPASETPTAENSIFSGVDEDEIGAAFDQALGGEGVQVTNPFQPTDIDSTRVMDEESVKRFAEMSQGGTPTPVAAPPAVVSYEWFVAVDEVQTGPVTESRVKELWDRGEIGPDSLTWRQGLPDWIPLSEVTELAALLAPRPSRPIFSPGSTPAPPSVVTVPVESAFSAGGVTRTVRAEVPMATPDSGFRPAASAALASLAKDEIEALNKPPPPKEPPPPAPKQLLEVPEEPVKRTGPSATAMPAVRPGGNGAPTAPTPFAYRAPTATSPAARRGLTMGLAVLGAVVAALVVVVGYQTFFRPPAVVSIAPSPPVAPPVAPPPAPPAAASATAAPSQTPAPPAKESPPPPPAKASPPPALAKAPTPVPAAEAPPRRSNTSRGTRSARSTSSGPADAPGLEGPGKDTIEGSKARTKSDDLFDEVFGTPDGKKAPPAGDKGKKVAAYVPPAPGVTDVPEKVGDGDIMSVVLANKAAVQRCADEQRSRDPNLHGTLVMHWVIQTSGKTTNVAPVTEAYKSSYFATCTSGLVKTWTFPKHRFSPGQAVDFPFKF